MQNKGKILIVDDNEDVLLSLNMLLKPHTEAIRVISNPDRTIEFMDSFHPDVIMLDMNFSKDAISGEEGYELLKKVLEHDPQAVVLFITAYVDTEKAVRAIKAGAIDFIPKPWDKQKLLEIVDSAVELRRSKDASPNNRDNSTVAVTTNKKGSNGGKTNNKVQFIGECPAIIELKNQIERIAGTDANVLITGENGAGKDVVAHALHQLSHRKNKQFINIDLGCIPETLFESELFGYEKGAFTDARTAKEGKMEAGDGGTVFLDEIGNLTPQMQQKLLTVIEKRQVSRIGSNAVRNIDVRIIAATNANLRTMVNDGTFRQDLLYRINTIELHLPPLRERGNDIILLADHFISKMAEKYNRTAPSLTEDARKKLRSHSWPGNVRELLHSIERAVVLSTGTTLSADDIILEQTYENESKANGNATTNIEETPLNLEDLERQAIQRAISLSNGNLTQAAEWLGITRYALYRKIEKLGI